MYITCSADPHSDGGEVSPGERLYYRHVIVFTPLAATVFGLASIGLLAAWELYQQRKLKDMLEKEDVSVQIGKPFLHYHKLLQLWLMGLHGYDAGGAVKLNW